MSVNNQTGSQKALAFCVSPIAKAIGLLFKFAHLINKVSKLEFVFIETQSVGFGIQRWSVVTMRKKYYV